ncbi:MAG: penicillin-binding protein activator [Salinisphaeraceae bacterium]|nr:penicillin-binding protein activator [Salinisphaeraceae bacterium]
MISNAFEKKPLRKLATIIATVCLLSACATSGPADGGGSIWKSPLPPLMDPSKQQENKDQEEQTKSDRFETRAAPSPAEIKERRKQDNRAAETLLRDAEDTEGAEQQRLLLQAAEKALLAGRQPLAAQALELLGETGTLEFNDEEQLRLTLVKADMGHYADRPLTLLSILPKPGLNYERVQAARIWRLRSQAHLILGQTIPATQALVNRERMLRSRSDIKTNRRLIWRTLRSVPPGALDETELAQADKTTRGWVELAQIMLDLWLPPTELSAATRQWQQQYPGHPANQVVLGKPSRAKRSPRRMASGDGRVDKIALLLPLTGNYSLPATAVRDGFMVAYYARPQPRPDVLVYDTNGNAANVNNLAAQAIKAGADVIVGPLTKDAVAQIASNPDINVPVLTLNYLENGVIAPQHTYQFGLSPEDEASQTAERAINDGHFRALALVPRTDWGQRSLSAFSKALSERGGQLLEYSYYNPDDRDFQEPIKQLLQYDRQRAASIDAAKNRRRDGEDGIRPYSAIRTDFDFIFLVAKPEAARLIRPQLRFYRASAVPVYATSQVYTGNLAPQQDQDLDGIQFGDAPWTLAPSGTMAAARDKVAELWPAKHARYPRLYAMGYDAYALASQLAVGKMRSGFGFPGATGLLTLENDGRISRGLQWARFSGGQPRLLGDSTIPIPTYPDGRPLQ